MNEYEILSIVRFCLKDILENFPISCCYEASIISKKVLNDFGIDCNVVCGKCFDCEEHYWNTINDEIFDMTWQQFCAKPISKSKYKSLKVIEYFEEADENKIDQITKWIIKYIKNQRIYKYKRKDLVNL